MQLLRLIMLFVLLHAQAAAADNILEQAVDQFEAITSYSATMRSYGEDEQIIKYRYKKPGFVRMDFVKPHKDAALVYRPDTGKVQLRPFGFINSLTLTMEPTSSLVKSPSGHRVDESSLGFLLQNAQELALQGSMKIVREEVRLQTTMVVLEITGKENVLVDGVHRYLLWIDKELKLPRIVESYDNEDQLIEGLFLEEMIINPDFADIFSL